MKFLLSGEVKFLLLSSFEAYFYDLEAVADEADDPLKAVLFHWPPDLSDEHVILVAGHLVRNFFSWVYIFRNGLP